MALTTSIMRGGVNNHETTSEEANGVYTDFVSEGVLGTIANTSGVAPATGAYAVNAQGTPDMTVAVTAGTAYVTATPSTQGSQTFRVVSSAEEDVTISANSSGSTKYDWVYLKLDATLLNAPNVAGTDAATLVTSRSSSISTDDGTPPTYGILLAIVTVSNGAATITNGNIKDLRERTSIGASTTDSTGWLSLGATPGTVTALGNRSYTLLFDNTDLTDTVSEGMRLRLTRTVSAPTQCTHLNGTTQYWTKASPTGISFTTTFSIAGWIQLDSYNGTNQHIMSQRNSITAGWQFRIDASGRLEAGGYRIGGNNKVSTTYQSVPLGKKVHVAVTVNMTTGASSGFTFYIDGVSVPTLTVQTGTATALVQVAQDLVVGADTAGATPFDGQLSQMALYSTELSAATIRAMASQTLSGAEAGNISTFTFNGNGNDSNANANNLSAQGSATATTVSSPFGNYLGGTLDYAIITKTAFSTNTTLTVQVPEGCTIPTSGGVSAVSYSTQAVPYGFVRDSGRWDILGMYRAASTDTTVSAGTWYNIDGRKLNVPIGSWNLSFETVVRQVNSVAGVTMPQASLSLSNTTVDDAQLTSGIVSRATSTSSQDNALSRNKNIKVATSSPYYLLIATQAGGGTITIRHLDSADQGVTTITAEFKLL